MGDKIRGECRLPDEILAKIFSFCSFGTIFNVMLTSRRFRDCANINSVWKRKLKQLIGFDIPTEQSKMFARDVGNLNESGSYKEICRRFSSIFDSKFKYDDELLRCSKCGQTFCSFDCIHDRDETIAFDFGSKTTWFKYTGEMTGQLSMHPTVAPVGDDNWSSWNSMATADSVATTHDCCPFCARRKFRRGSPRSGAADTAADRKPGQVDGKPGQVDRKPGQVDGKPGQVDGKPGQVDGKPGQVDGKPGQVDGKPGQVVGPSNRLTKALLRFSSFRNLRCFRVSDGGEDDDDLIVLCDSDTRESAVVPDIGGLSDSSSDVLANRRSKAITTYRFLLQHMLSRSSFYHLHNIPFVICEPIECDRTMMLELVKHILCQLKAPGVCFVPKAVAIALYSGLETCLVVDSGADNTVVTPVVDSLALTDCVQRLKIGGTHLTQQLMTCLSTKGIDIEVNEINIDSSHVKRECYLPLDTQLESRKRVISKDINIKGTKDDKPKYFDVKLSHELYQLAEDMYLNLALPQLILQSVNSLDTPLRKRLLSNIIMTGGNCRLSGLAHRLTHDLRRAMTLDEGHWVRVVDPRLMTGRSDAVVGASYVKKWHRANWISRRDFVAYGDTVLDRCNCPWYSSPDRASNRFDCASDGLPRAYCRSHRPADEFSPFV